MGMQTFTPLTIARFQPLTQAVPSAPPLRQIPLSRQILVRLSLLTVLSASLWPARTIAAPLSLSTPASRANSPSQTVPPNTIELHATDELPENDLPEEVLRTEIIVDARSPIDGKPLTAQEYAELLVEIDQANQVDPTVSPKVRQTVGLLKLRKFLKTILPILPIK
ncbi:hypothetical protein ACN4EG_04030 [Alkalinema pantanalense CENA528]|uniref:hypothetical protein n=1 Tax=Alkalinema pantanalense TaxID=1620705 RepID=UPI003D6E0D96